MSTIALTSWNIICKPCAMIRNALMGTIAFIIASGEIAGRSRAAAELTRQGYHKEAKALMVEIKELRGEV
tara:strand:- start:769 stop:978 length:210 start_codon:yes stop_codon:yes gene_type:complete